jgi:hypothetical protein
MASKHTRCGKESARHRNGKPAIEAAEALRVSICRQLPTSRSGYYGPHCLHRDRPARNPSAPPALRGSTGMPRPEFFVVFSAKPGPRLYVGAAIHGDEVTGVSIITGVLKDSSCDATLAGA